MGSRPSKKSIARVEYQSPSEPCGICPGGAEAEPHQLSTAWGGPVSSFHRFILSFRWMAPEGAERTSTGIFFGGVVTLEAVSAWSPCFVTASTDLES